jgi:hypothetical protein
VQVKRTGGHTVFEALYQCESENHWSANSVRGRSRGYGDVYVRVSKTMTRTNTAKRMFFCFRRKQPGRFGDGGVVNFCLDSQTREYSATCKK